MLTFSLLLALVLPAHHEIHVTLTPTAHRISVTDTLTLQERTVRFLLHEGLQPTTNTPGAEIHKLDRRPRAEDFGLPAARFRAPDVPVELWEATLPAGATRLTLRYAGVLDHPVQPAPEEQARGFAETPGTIGPEGVFLTGASFWIPWTGAAPFPFKLTVDLPEGWSSVSQGKRTRQGRSEVWDSPEPQTEVTLVAGRFVE